MARVLVIPDLQIPFHHPDSLKFLKKVARQYNTDTTVCIGDEIDFHALSDYDHDPDGWSAGDELKVALKQIKPFYKAFPNVKSCISNHTSRPFRKAYKYGIPRAFLRDYAEFLEAPNGWEWRDNWMIDEVQYEHGHELGGGGGKTATSSAPVRNSRSTVFGHFHTNAGVLYTATPELLMFGFNVGCLINFKAYAFAYAKATKARPILGCGIVINGIPTFVPMLLDKKGRWVGKLVGT